MTNSEGCTCFDEPGDPNCPIHAATSEPAAASPTKFAPEIFANIPAEFFTWAHEIATWMKTNGHEGWKLGPIQQRTEAASQPAQDLEAVAESLLNCLRPIVERATLRALCADMEKFANSKLAGQEFCYEAPDLILAALRSVKR